MAKNFFHERENEAASRFIKFIDDVQVKRRDRGEEQINEQPKFIAKLLRQLSVYVRWRDEAKQLEKASSEVLLIQKLSAELQSALFSLDARTRSLLGSKLQNEAASLRGIRDIKEAAALLLPSPRRGRRGDKVIQNAAKGFVVICIEHGWLPIRVSNSVLEGSLQSEHCRCLALLFEISGIFEQMTNDKDREKLLLDKASNQLRMLRRGFEYVVQSPEQVRFGEWNAYTALFSGKVYAGRLQDYFDDDFHDGYEDENLIHTLPSFIPH